MRRPRHRLDRAVLRPERAQRLAGEIDDGDAREAVEGSDQGDLAAIRRPGVAHAAGTPGRTAVLTGSSWMSWRFSPRTRVVEPEVPPAAPVGEVRQPRAVRREAGLRRRDGLIGAVTAAVNHLTLAVQLPEPDPAGVPGHVRDAPLLPRYGHAIGDRRVEDEVALAGDASGHSSPFGSTMTMCWSSFVVTMQAMRPPSGAGDRRRDAAVDARELAGRAAVDGDGVELAVRGDEDDGLGVQPVEDAAAVRGGRLGAGVGGQAARRAAIGRHDDDVAAPVEALQVGQPAAVRRPAGLGERPDPRHHACRHSHRPLPPQCQRSSVVG